MFKTFKKAMIFPYNNELLELYKYREMLPFEIQSVVSFKSWGYVGKNAGSIEGGKPGSHLISGDFEQELAQVDSVILGLLERYHGDPQILETYLNKICAAGKNVLVLGKMAQEQIDFYKQRFSEQNREFYAIKFNFEHEDYTRLLPVPVLGIFGTDAESGKLDLQIQIASALKGAGYRVGMLGANPQLALLGGTIYPAVLDRHDVSETRKIKILRSLANVVVEREQCDILLVTAPYGMNNYEEDRWDTDLGKNGLLAHIVMEAMKPDANMLTFNPGDLRWAKRSLTTMETLSAAPTLAVAARRLMRIPLKGYEKFKYTLLDDKMFELHREVWREHLHSTVIDLEKIEAGELVHIIEKAFDADRRLEAII